MKLLDKIRASKHYDKYQHFGAGLLVSAAFYLSLYPIVWYAVYTANQSLMMSLMFLPVTLVGMWIAAFVHGSKEFNDYLAKRRGENHEVSLLDFAAGMAGSYVGLWLLF